MSKQVVFVAFNSVINYIRQQIVNYTAVNVSTLEMKKE